MQMDKLLMLADKLSLVGALGAQFSQGIYIGTPEVIPGRSTMKPPSRFHESDFQLLVQMTTDLDSAGDVATLKVEVGEADDEVGTNFVALRDSGAIAQATCIAGYEFAVGGQLPRMSKAYLIARLTSAVADPTAGKITIALVRSRQSNQLP